MNGGDFGVGQNLCSLKKSFHIKTEDCIEKIETKYVLITHTDDRKHRHVIINKINDIIKRRSLPQKQTGS